MREYDASKPLFSLHVPKCGGNSLQALLKLLFGDGLHFLEPAQVPPPESLGAGSCVHGHFDVRAGLGVRETYAKAEQFITMLREPLAAAVSMYWMTVAANPGREAAMPCEAWLLDNPALDFADYLPSDLTLSNFEAVLASRFVYVGVLEDLQSSANVLCHRLGAHPRVIGWSNGREYAGSISEGVRAAFRHRHELSYALYEYALRTYRDEAVTRAWFPVTSAPPKESAGGRRPLPAHRLPLRLSATMGSRCDANCLWCNRGEIPVDLEQLAHARRVIESRERGRRRELLLGLHGSPCVTHPELPELLASARALGCETVWLYGSGIAAAHPGWLRRAREAGITGLLLDVASLDSSLGDLLHGRQGATAAKLRGIEAALAEQLEVAVGLLFVRPVLRGLPSVAEHFSRLAQETPRLSYFGRLLDSHLLSCPSFRGRYMPAILPSLGEVAHALEQVRRVSPALELIGRGLPLCLQRRLGTDAVALLEGERLQAAFDAPPESCAVCAVRGECRWVGKPQPELLSIERRWPDALWAERLRELVGAGTGTKPLRNEGGEGEIWQARVIQRLSRRRTALLEASVSLDKLIPGPDSVALHVTVRGKRAFVFVQRRETATSWLVAGRHFALSHSKDTNLDPRVGMRILRELEATESAPSPTLPAPGPRGRTGGGR